MHHSVKELQLQTKPIAKKLGEGRVELLTGLMRPEHMQRLAPTDCVPDLGLCTDLKKVRENEQ